MPQILSQPEEKGQDGETMIWIKDFPGKVFLLNLNKTLLYGKSIIEKEYNFIRPGTENVLFASNATYIINDSVFLLNRNIQRSVNSDNENPSPMYRFYNFTQDKYIDTMKLKFRLGDWEYMNKDKNKIVSISFQENLIGLYDLNHTTETILYQGNRVPEKILPSGNNQNDLRDFIYSSCFIKDNYIFVLTRKNERKSSEEKIYCPSVYVFNLNGEPLCNLIMKDSIDNICYDDKTSVLYGLDSGGQLYAYDLKEIL